MTNDAGEVTSHLIGMWYRTIKFGEMGPKVACGSRTTPPDLPRLPVEAGIKPVFVFDGKPPELKGGELAKRSALKAAATEALEGARESGVIEDIVSSAEEVPALVNSAAMLARPPPASCRTASQSAP